MNITLILNEISIEFNYNLQLSFTSSYPISDYMTFKTFLVKVIPKSILHIKFPNITIFY